VIKITWDENKISNSGATSAGLLTPTDWNDMVTDQKTRLQNLVEDTTPQLGGELDCQANTIGFTLNSLTTSTVDWKSGNKVSAELTSATTTFVFVAPTKSCNLCMKLIQDTAGGRLVTFPAEVKFPAGTAPVLTTGTGKVDIISMFFDGSNYYASSSLNY
jgi:hypothetical protein